MPKHEQSVVIARPIDEVFTYMNDVSREHEWQPQLLEAHQTPPGETAVGSERRYVSEFLGKRLENVYLVKVFEPNRQLVVESTRESAIQATTDMRWEAVDGGTKVTMAVEGSPTGVLRFIPKALVEGAFENEVRSALSRLKERLEST